MVIIGKQFRILGRRIHTDDKKQEEISDFEL